MQTKKRSLCEVICNVGTGILTAYLTWVYIIIPWVELLKVDLNHLTGIGVIVVNFAFTVVSVARGYVWRRMFNLFD